MAIRTIRVTPTLDTSAYAVGDVLFVGTEVTLPAKSCFLRGVQAVVKDTDGASQEINLLFFQKNTTALGTINATANISGANLLANNYLGGTKLVGGAHGLDSAAIYNQQELNDAGATVGGGVHGFCLEADPTDASNNHVVYVQGINTVGTGTYAASDLELILTVEY